MKKRQTGNWTDVSDEEIFQSEPELELEPEFEETEEDVFGDGHRKKAERENLFERIIDAIEEKFGETVFVDAANGLHNIYNKDKRIVFGIAIVSAVLSCFIVLKASNGLARIFGSDLSAKSNLSIIIAFLPVVLFLFVFFNFIAWAISQIIYKESYHDDERNYNKAKTGEYGTSQWLNKNPKKFYETFNTGTDISKIEDDILGLYKEGNDEYTCLRNDLKGINKNIMIVGSPGCGKSATYVNNKVFQCIKRGESCVITDSKGAIYAETAKQAKEAGYKLKVLNLTSKGLAHSDSCNFLKFVQNDESRIMQLAKTVIRNTTDGKGDFWTDSEYNLLVAALYYVVFSKTIKDEDKTFGYVYQNILSKSVEELESIFGVLGTEHPAYRPYRIFSNGNDTVKGNTLAGLGIRLQIFSNPIIQQITGFDDIDLAEIGREKCIYYVIIPDQDNTFNFIATMFFALLFMVLVEDADERVDADQKLPVPVNFILDEFFSTGSIEGFEKKVATVRSRGISIAIILQDIGQLIEMYGDNIANSIMGGCSMKMLLATNDQTTADFFSKAMGEQTIFMKNKRYSESSFDLIKIHPGYTVTEGLGTRSLMNADEIMNSLDSNEFILLISGRHPTKLKKYFFQNHPMYNKDASSKLRANDNYPKWARIKDEKIQDKKSKVEALKNKNNIEANGEEKFHGETKPKQKNSYPVAENKPKQNGMKKKTKTIAKRINPDGSYDLFNTVTGEIYSHVSANEAKKRNR